MSNPAEESGGSQGGSGKPPNFTPSSPPVTVRPGGAETESKVWTTGQGATTIDTSRWVYFPRTSPEYADFGARQQGNANFYSYNTVTTQDYANLSWNDLSLDQQRQLTVLAKARGSGSSTGKGLWETAVAMAERDYRQGRQSTPYDYLNTWIGQYSDGGMGSDGSGGGYKGPVSTVTNLNDTDLRLMADTVSSTVLGRGVTDDEYKMIRSQVRSAESANPSVSGGVRSPSMTNVSGLSGEARQDVITRALLQQDGAKEFTMATKMMGALDDFLRERPDV